MLQREPDDVFITYGLAMELVKEGRMDEAMQRFDRVLQLDPAYTTAYFQKGSALLSHGRLDEAVAVLQSGIAAARKAGDHHAADEMGALLESARS